MVRGEAALTRRKAARRKKISSPLFFCFNAASLSIRKKNPLEPRVGSNETLGKIEADF